MQACVHVKSIDRRNEPLLLDTQICPDQIRIKQQSCHKALAEKVSAVYSSVSVHDIFLCMLLSTNYNQRNSEGLHVHNN